MAKSFQVLFTVFTLFLVGFGATERKSHGITPLMDRRLFYHVAEGYSTDNRGYLCKNHAFCHRDGTANDFEMLGQSLRKKWPEQLCKRGVNGGRIT